MIALVVLLIRVSASLPTFRPVEAFASSEGELEQESESLEEAGLLTKKANLLSQIGFFP